MAKITVVGAGTFGISLAVMVDEHGHKAALWTPFKDQADELNSVRESKNLPGIILKDSIVITHEQSVLKDAELIIIATPSTVVRQVARSLSGVADSSAIIVCVSKGIEAGSHLTLDEVISEELPSNPIAVLSGPSHAEEVSRKVETTVVVAANSIETAEKVQDMLMNEHFRIYVSDDMLGVELGGALKNVIALAAGALDGLGAGDNTKAALMTRGLTEITRLGVAKGGRAETFSGLSGIGDLIVTCSSLHSRNRKFGMLIGQGMSVAKALEEVGMVVEGYANAKVAYDLAQTLNVPMPITEQIYMVLYEGKDLKGAIRDLMGRPKRHESEKDWLYTRE